MGYLLYKGRFPLRVSVPLLLGEVLLLLALLLYGVGDGWKSRFEKVGVGSRIGRCLVVSLSCCFLFTCFSSGRRQYSYIRGVNDAQRVMMEDAKEVEAYCSASPEKKYILDMWTVQYHTGSALETQIYQGRNNVVSGSWYSNSPCVRRYHAQYFSGAEEIYFIAYDDGRGEEHPGLRWLTEETGVSPRLCDSFTTTLGVVRLVWRYDLTTGAGAGK